MEAFSNTYPHVDIELLTGSRLFSLAQREADIAFRTVPFEGADIIQRKLIQMPYGVYIRKDYPDPPSDGNGTRLITMDIRRAHSRISSGYDGCSRKLLSPCAATIETPKH